MKPERLAFASSLVLLGGLLVREVLNVRIRLRTMAIKYSILKSLAEDEKFVALHFNPFYDNRTLAKDLVSLEAYREQKDQSLKTMPRVPLEAVNKGDVYLNETEYSTYELTQENIRVILACFGDDPAIKHVLFVPEPYREDERYFAYRLIPADATKKELPVSGRVAVQSHSLATAVNSGNDEQEESNTMQFFSMTTQTGLLYVNPSPPASSSFEQA